MTKMARAGSGSSGHPTVVVEAQSLGLSAAVFPRPIAGTGLEVKQLGHEPVLIWDGSVEGCSFTCYTTMLVLKSHFLLWQGSSLFIAK